MEVDTPTGIKSQIESESPMCRPVHCRVCGLTTWAGCGQHVAQVRATVPSALWCAGGHTAEERAAAGGGGWLSRLLGR